jgi:hypothetical protein
MRVVSNDVRLMKIKNREKVSDVKLMEMKEWEVDVEVVGGQGG